MREEILALVAERSGMVFAPNRRAEAEAGIARAMKHAGADDLAAYLILVRRDGIALDDLVDELTVGETHFMRDPDQMDLIRREVLPALKRRRGSGAAARVWSAGCATGEEPYSLAILIEEEGLDDGAIVLGTDLSTAALEKARAGSYSDWSMRGVSSQFLQDYFRHVRRRRIVVDRIRNKVRFERLNLVGQEDYAAAGAFGMDLILCRNVLLYFGRETAGRIAARLFDCLAEGGVLLTAGADLLLGEYAPFEVEVTPVGLVYRRPGGAPGAPSQPWGLQAAERAGFTPASVAGGQGGATEHAAAQAAERAGFTPASVAGGQGGATEHPPAQDAEPDLGREAFDRVMGHANANGAFEAERIAQAALRRHPLDAQLHYLRAALLLCLDRDEEAEHGAQRALYLDPSLAIAHFLLGTILRKRGAQPGALRAFRNVRDLCAARLSDEEVPAGGGERVGALHSAAEAEMERLEVTVG
jgi:chemotaxis protein methyltransferase CheR